MISLTSAFRCERGLSVIETRPLLLVGFTPSAPIDEATEATSGSDRIVSSTVRCRFVSRANEASGCATETPTMSPVSCKGKKPFGMTTASSAVRSSVPTVTSSVAGWCARTHLRLRSYSPSIQAKPLSNVRANLPSRSSARGLSRCAHIIAVSVSESTAETQMAMASVTANSRKSRPMIPPMNNSGMSTATSDTVSETMVNPICLEPLSAASKGGSPCSMKRAMFSIMTMASSTTNPVEMVSAMRERLLRLYPHRYITAKVPISESGTAIPGMIVARSERRNM